MSQLIIYDAWNDISKDIYSALSLILYENNIDNVDGFAQTSTDKNRFAMEYSLIKRNFYLSNEIDWNFATYTGNVIAESNSQGERLYKMPSNFIRFTKDNYYYSNAQINYGRDLAKNIYGNTFKYIGYVKDSNNEDGRIVPILFHEIVAYDYLCKRAETPFDKSKYAQMRFEAMQRAKNQL